VIALDTNILVYAHRGTAPEHVAAQRAIERAANDPRGCGVSAPCIGEFWGTVTHPTLRGGPSTPSQAARFIRSLIHEAQLRVWMPADGLAERLIRRAEELSILGRRIFDLQIGIIALENGAEELWTHDRNFVPIRGLQIVDPL
jgi:predicted nucleic acid-binding protein